MRFTVLKYSSIYTCHDVQVAAKRVEEAKKRWPDREYTILTNMRGGATKFIAAQVETVLVDIPTEEELALPPLPERPRAVSMYSQAYKDWEHELRRRQELLKLAAAPALAVIRRRLNR